MMRMMVMMLMMMIMMMMMMTMTMTMTMTMMIHTLACMHGAFKPDKHRILILCRVHPLQDIIDKGNTQAERLCMVQGS